MEDAIATPDTRMEIKKEILIAAAVDIVWETVLEQLGPSAEWPNGQDMKFKLEAWPGGRWFRDLGNNTGHLWGHVQVIKPPSVIELIGPMMMSYPAINHVQYRLTADGSGTKLNFSHRAFGEILLDHRQGMPKGWQAILETIQKRAISKTK
jgi:uncharacterized protein YndB with AHSA1/START domain